MRKMLLTLLLPVIFLLNGCFGVSNEFKGYQKDLTQSSGIKQASEEVEFSVGRMTLYFAEKFTGYIDRDLLAEMTLHDISKFEIGVYQIRDEDIDKSGVYEFENKLKSKGWSKFIKSADNEDITNIFINIDGDEDEIGEMMILTSDSENIVLMRFEGNFNRIVNRLIKARKIALK